MVSLLGKNRDVRHKTLDSDMPVGHFSPHDTRHTTHATRHSNQFRPAFRRSTISSLGAHRMRPQLTIAAPLNAPCSPATGESGKASGPFHNAVIPV
ncbi:MAG TPA: hypothetical protein HPP94_03465 [Desulfuromonadales bacterium]|nr:hypothetical protein [Desulfuromonadales bacterium]